MKLVVLVLLLFSTGFLVAGGLEPPSLPLALCIPAVDAAKSRYPTEKEQLEFLRGFRYGAEKAECGEFGRTSLDDETSAHAEGFKSARELLKQGQPLRSRVSLADFGYELIDWKRGRLFFGPEQSHFTPEGQKERYWVVIPDYVGARPSGYSHHPGTTCWVRGWLSPEGMRGHMGGYRRQLVANDIYRQEKKPGMEPNR